MAPSTTHQTLYLIDLSSFIFRAFYAIRALSNKKGEPTNAVYGVITMLGRLLDEAKPTHVMVAFDSKEPSFRKVKYEEYKANRSAPPEALIPQFDRIEQMVKALEFPSLRISGIEADDLIATAAIRWREQDPKNEVVIVTGDKDLMQLVDERTRVWDTMNQKVYQPTDVEAKFGVRPDQIRDYLALVGDSSDNIPGIPGVGPKTATDLLKEYGTLDGVLAAAQAGKISGKRGTVIAQSVDIARLSQDLTTLKYDCEIELTPESSAYEFHLTPSLVALMHELDFQALLKKWEAKLGLVGSTVATSVADVAPGIGGAQKPSPFSLTSDAAMPLPTTSMPSMSSTSSAMTGETITVGLEGSEGASSAPPSISDDNAPAPRFITVLEKEVYSDLLAKIEKAGEFGFDLETTSLNPRLAEIVGIALAVDLTESFYVPISHRATSIEQLPADWVLAELKPLLENPRLKKIGQNLKYDFSVLLANGIAADGIGADTMIAAYLIDSDGRHNLQALARNYLSYEMLTYEEICGKGAKQIGFDLVPIDQATRYSAEDAWVALKLWRKLQPRLQSQQLMEVFARIELPMVPVLLRMEMQGVCINVPWLNDLSREFSQDLARIEERVAAYTTQPVNLNSPKQLAQLLFEELKLPVQSKTKTGYSTDAEVLEILSPLHEVPRLLLEYREITKLKGTYVDPLPRMKDPKTGKIHASFHQTVAATGRLSSSDPNLQNIPIRTDRGKRIRGAFVAGEGNVLLSADYSQIELRLLAHMSEDTELVASFLRDEDVHRRTASEIFSIAPDDVDDRQRGIAKAINFGLMYGKTAFGLSQELGISRREAADTIERYFLRYRGVKEFLTAQVELAKERGYSETLLGRRRFLPDINSRNHAVRANAERMAMNAPIQGTAADLMKLAMIEIDEALHRENYRSRLTIQVHDEVVLECPREEAEKTQALVVKLMEGALKLKVPLRVNAAIGENWMEL